MIDIISADENGLGTFDTETDRAKNILSIQFDSLEYEPDLGIDLDFFLKNEFEFQNESFVSYLIQVLANRGINVSSVNATVERFAQRLVINLVPAETSTGMIK